MDHGTDDPPSRQPSGMFGHLQSEVDSRARAAAIGPADLLGLTREARRALKAILLHGEMAEADIARESGLDRVVAQEVLDGLVQDGFLQQREVADGWRYRVSLTRRGRAVPGDLWGALQNRAIKPTPETGEGSAS
jgi:hypothetical protein